MENKIVEKAGAWFSYQDAKIGQGRENSKRYLEENPATLEEIKQKILSLHGLGKKVAMPITDSVDIETGEILEEEIAPKKEKKSKKTVQ